MTTNVPMTEEARERNYNAAKVDADAGTRYMLETLISDYPANLRRGEQVLSADVIKMLPETIADPQSFRNHTIPGLMGVLFAHDASAAARELVLAELLDTDNLMSDTPIDPDILDQAVAVACVVTQMPMAQQKNGAAAASDDADPLEAARVRNYMAAKESPEAGSKYAVETIVSEYPRSLRIGDQVLSEIVVAKLPKTIVDPQALRNLTVPAMVGYLHVHGVSGLLFEAVLSSLIDYAQFDTEIKVNQLTMNLAADRACIDAQKALTEQQKTQVPSPE